MSLVYSTAAGRLCPDCGNAVAACTCKHKTAPVGDGRVRISRQTKGRGGKAVTVITGLPLGEAELQALAKTLKQRCGTGGAVKDGTIEIQGDQREHLQTQLQALGYAVTRSGG